MPTLDKENRNINWYHASLMALTVVLGFGDVVNTYASQGLGIITTWIIMIIFYMLPYSLMAGQLGSTFSEKEGGVTSWIKSTSGAKLGYLTAWTYWMANVPYIAEVPQNIVIAISWLINKDESFTESHPLMIQSIVLVVFFIFLWVASRGIPTIKVVGTIGGIATGILTLLFIVLGIFTLTLPSMHIATQPFDWHAFIPKFDFRYFTTIALLIFSLNGCEIVAPYTTKMKNPKKDFPKAMIALSVMVALMAIFGSFALGLFFNSYDIPKDLKMNGQFYAFQILGQHYHVGNLFLYIFSFADIFAQGSVLAVLIDANTRILVSDTGDKYIPKSLRKLNKHGTPTHGYTLTAILVIILSILPLSGIHDMYLVYNWLLNLNAIVSPMCCLWIFYAFIRIRMPKKQLDTGYVFIKNRRLAIGVGVWCFAITMIAVLFGLVPDVEYFSSQWYFQLGLNIVSPIFLILLGLLLPLAARMQQRQK